MKRKLMVKEGEPFRLAKGDDLAVQLGSMAELMENKGLRVSEAPTHSFVTPSMIGHYGFHDGSEIDVIPDTKEKHLNVSNRALTRMMYTIFGIRSGTDDMNLFEFFVKVFLDDVKMLMRKGFRSAYSQIQGNETVFKGRLLFAENIRENLVHKERVYVEYELFTTDRPENRVIKGTLESLVKRSKDDRNMRDIKVMLMNLEDIPSPKDITRDMSACKIDRNMADYELPLMWCSVFLGMRGKSFALLMDADEVFEAYVARVSSVGMDGSMSVRCNSETVTDDVSVTTVHITWQYRNRDGTVSEDAESMYMNAIGFARIPFHGENRMRSMAMECAGGIL